MRKPTKNYYMDVEGYHNIITEIDSFSVYVDKLVAYRRDDRLKELISHLSKIAEESDDLSELAAALLRINNGDTAEDINLCSASCLGQISETQRTRGTGIFCSANDLNHFNDSIQALSSGNPEGIRNLSKRLDGLRGLVWKSYKNMKVEMSAKN